MPAEVGMLRRILQVFVIMDSPTGLQQLHSKNLGRDQLAGAAEMLVVCWD